MITQARKPIQIPKWVRVVISLLLIGVLLWTVDVKTFARTIAGADALMLFGLLCGVYTERIYSALRWYQVLRWSGARVPLPVVVRISFISSFAGLFLPGALGAEAIRVVGLARYSADLAMAFSSVLIDRMIAVLTLVPLVLIGLALAPAEMPAGIQFAAWGSLAAVLVLAFMLLHSWPRRWVEILLPEAIGRIVLPRLERLYAALGMYRARPALLGVAVILALGFQMVRVAVVWFSARAVGIDVPTAYYFIFSPIIVFLGMVPISFASIGVREATYVYLFSLVGVPAEQSFAASILVQFMGLLSCLPGAVLYARGSRQRKQVGEEQLCVHS